MTAQDAALSLERCDALLAEDPAELDSYRCYWILARQGRADEAARRLQSLVGHDPADHRAKLFLARIDSDRGRDAAEGLYREAARGFAASRDARGEVLARLSLAAFFVRRGRFAEAGSAVDAASSVAEANGDPVLRARVLTQRGWLAHQRGDFAVAWRLFKTAEAQVVPDGPLDLQALCLSGLGAVAQETQQLEASMEYIRRQADVSHRLGDFYDEARARGNLVITAFRLGIAGRMERAAIETLAREALAAAVAGANRGSEARAHLYLADITSGLEARERYRRGLDLAREVGEVPSVIIGLRGLAMSLVETEPRDPAEAFRLVDQSIGLARAIPYYAALAHAARAHMRWITGPRERAVADSLAALDAAEAIRDLQDDGVARARVFSVWTFAYHRLVGRLLAAPRPSPADLDLAFSVTERMRARVLLDQLDAAQATGALAPRGPAQERRSGVLQAIGAVQRRLMSSSIREGDRREALRELERLELEEQGIRGEMARANPAFGLLRAPVLPALAEMRGLLGDNEALLSFSVSGRTSLDNRTTENGSWVFVVTRDGTRFHPVPDRDALGPAVALYVGLLERRDGSEGRSGARLHHDLVAQALRDLPPGVSRLVIIPDGPLHRLPFDALRPSPAAEPLAARYQISLAPSATLWSRWRRSGRPAGRSAVLILADPDQPQGRLPHARREAHAIARHLGAGAKVLIGPEASESFLKRTDLGRFGVIHLAAHAVADEERPERSAVFLAAGAPEEDGLLQTREIVGLDLAPRIVVLSACRSASGSVVEGEGPMSLARGFFQAGARAVVGSLWPLRDDDAEELVRELYRHLAAGRSVAAALAAARRDRIRQGAPPAAWAGLVALGDGEVVPLPAGLAAEDGTGVHSGRAPVLVFVILLGLMLLAARRLLNAPR